MTCNAIATAAASVDLGAQLANLLGAKTADGQKLIRALIVKALQAAKYETMQDVGTTVFGETTNHTVTVKLDETGRLAVQVRGGYIDREVIARTVTSHVAIFLKSAAGLVLQQKIKQAVAARGTVYSETRGQDGSLILNVEL